MKCLIRKMSKKDINEVQNVAKESWHATYEGIIPREIQDNFLKHAYSDDMMEYRLKNSYMYVAEVEGEVIGFINFSSLNENNESELSAFYINPEYQGHGIGTQLLQTCTSELTKLKAIYLDVEKENNIGLSFYKKKGFEVVDEYDDNFDGHILKTLRMKLEV